MISNFQRHQPLHRAFAAIIAASLVACAIENTQLNSERIEAKFGNYGIDVRENNATTRRSSLFSIAADGKVCRTYAVVQYLDATAEAIRDVHERIIAGASIGASFKGAGWNVIKKTVHIGTLNVTPDNSVISELMHLPEPERLAVHIYQLSVEKEGQQFDYAIIAETHHPDYLGSSDLLRIYPFDRRVALDAAYVNEITALILTEK